MDNLSSKQRSECMSKIRSKWTSPEKKIHNYLKGWKIKHKMHPKITGSPDILVNRRTAVFIHGCFWHKCPVHYRVPSSNKRYWSEKIKKNLERDKQNIYVLKKNNYEVFKVWEHQMKEDVRSCVLMLKRL